MTSRRLRVVDYDPMWPTIFRQLYERIWPEIEGVAVALEHVGSTAVPGLAAKPVIDMTIVVANQAAIPAVIDRVQALGYRHRGDLGIEGREAFEQPAVLPNHHLYACLQGNVALRNHLAVRDRLRADETLAERYGRLKKQLAERFPFDIDAYVDGKTDLILEILGESSLSQAELSSIENANRSQT